MSEPIRCESIIEAGPWPLQKKPKNYGRIIKVTREQIMKKTEKIKLPK